MSALESFGVRFNRDNQKIPKSIEKMLLGTEGQEQKSQIERLYSTDIDFNTVYFHRKMFMEFMEIRKAARPQRFDLFFGKTPKFWAYAQYFAIS